MADAPDIEMLGYFPANLDDFLKFCVGGAPAKRGDTRERVGVFRWLYSRRVPKAQFYTSDPGDNVGVFIAALEKPANEGDMPWNKKEIFGFDDFVNPDSRFRMGKAFPTVNQLARVTRNVQLESQFETGRQHTDLIFKSLEAGNSLNLSFTIDEFTQALRGETSGTFAKIESEIASLNLPLLEHLRPVEDKRLRDEGVTTAKIPGPSAQL